VKWSWIIDFDEFGLKHSLGLNTGIQLSKLINRFGRLHQLIVINSNTFVDQMLKMIKLTLQKEYHNSIRIIHKNDVFLQEIESWRYLDENKNLLTQIIQ
jgi:hypothetical protein